MNEELFVADTVRRWAAESFPEVPVVADTAVAAALRAFAGGASVSEACREGRWFIECCGCYWSSSVARRPRQVA